MKIKIISISIILLTITCICYPQSIQGYRKTINEKSIPKIVTNTFSEQYPDVHLIDWYSTHITYWQNDYSSGWYNNWYGHRSIVVYKYEKPTYFEVEFIDNDGNDSRSIYDFTGYWLETRSKITDLPTPILNTLTRSTYSIWHVSPLKERIESPRGSTIYRFNVYKGKKSRIIRMDIEGNLIQAKYIND